MRDSVCILHVCLSLLCAHLHQHTLAHISKDMEKLEETCLKMSHVMITNNFIQEARNKTEKQRKLGIKFVAFTDIFITLRKIHSSGAGKSTTFLYTDTDTDP